MRGVLVGLRPQPRQLSVMAYTGSGPGPEPELEPLSPRWSPDRELSESRDTLKTDDNNYIALDVDQVPPAPAIGGLRASAEAWDASEGAEHSPPLISDSALDGKPGEVPAVLGQGSPSGTRPLQAQGPAVSAGVIAGGQQHPAQRTAKSDRPGAGTASGSATVHGGSSSAAATVRDPETATSGTVDKSDGSCTATVRPEPGEGVRTNEEPAAAAEPLDSPRKPRPKRKKAGTKKKEADTKKKERPQKSFSDWSRCGRDGWKRGQARGVKLVDEHGNQGGIFRSNRDAGRFLGCSDQKVSKARQTGLQLFGWYVHQCLPDELGLAVEQPKPKPAKPAASKSKASKSHRAGLPLALQRILGSEDEAASSSIDGEMSEDEDDLKLTGGRRRHSRRRRIAPDRFTSQAYEPVADPVEVRPERKGAPRRPVPGPKTAASKAAEAEPPPPPALPKRQRRFKGVLAHDRLLLLFWPGDVHSRRIEPPAWVQKSLQELEREEADAGATGECDDAQ